MKVSAVPSPVTWRSTIAPRHAELRCLESALTGEFVTARYEVVRG